MKKLIGIACSMALTAGLALYVPCWAAGGAGSQQDQSTMDKSTGGGSGGASSSDASVQQSTGGTTGGAAGGQDLDALKKSLNSRVKAVDKEISSAKKSSGDMTDAQKETMQLQLDQVQAKRDAVKRMIGNMKRAEDRSIVETAMADLEQSAKSISSDTQRSTPAGGSKSSGGATGGSSGDTGVSQSTGGATGGAAGMSVDAMKAGFSDRVDKAGRDLKEVQKSINNMQGTQKDTMQMELDKVRAKQAAAKKIVNDMKDPSVQAEVESTVADLEQSVKQLQSQTQRTSPAGGSKSSGGATGGSSAGSDMKESTGGATGGAGQTQDIEAMKKALNERIDKANRQLDEAKANVDNMSGARKDTMQLELDRVTGQRDAAKKMVSGMKNAGQQSLVESAVAEFEQGVQKLSAGTKRSSPAGESQSGGATGGAASTGTAVEQSTGGATGASAGKGQMLFSYDQRSQFKKTANTKLDSLDKRIDMLKQNAKMAPQDVNGNVMPKVDELSKMSGDIKSKIGKVDNSDRQAWNSTRTDINDNLSKLEMSLMEAEKDIS